MPILWETPDVALGATVGLCDLSAYRAQRAGRTVAAREGGGMQDQEPRAAQIRLVKAPDPDGSVVWVLAGVGLVLVAFTACLYALVWWLA